MWSVVSQDDQLSFALTECLQGLFVSQAEFAGFHHQGQTGVDGFQCLFLKVKEWVGMLVEVEMKECFTIGRHEKH